MASETAPQSVTGQNALLVSSEDGLETRRLKASDLGAGGSGTLTDRSGTITLGGTSQQAAAANSSRRYLLIENVSTGDLWVNFGTAAVASQPSIRLSAGGSYEPAFVPTGTVNVIGATTGQAYVCKEV